MTSSDLAFPKKSKKSSSPVLDGWKLTIAKISNKEPELLLDLLQAVLEKIRTQEALEYGRIKYEPSNPFRFSELYDEAVAYTWLVTVLP